MCEATGPNFIKHKHKILLFADKNSCLLSYQQKKRYIAVSGTLLMSCLAKEFAEHNFLLNSFMKMGHDERKGWGHPARLQHISWVM